MDRSLTQAVEAFGAGGFVIVVDASDREDEADLVIAAQACTPQAMGFMVRHCCGVVVVPMTAERLAELQLPQMCEHNTESNRTAFTVSVDAMDLTSSGMSASDRAYTIRALADPRTPASALRRPGHVFPLQARAGGVLERAGHTEAAVDLAKIAGMSAAAAICELVDDAGEALRGAAIADFGRAHRIPVLTISELIRHRLQHDRFVACVSRAKIPTEHGLFESRVYRNSLDQSEHIAMVSGSVDPDRPCLVRVHSECLTGDVLGSLRCDCGSQLRESLKAISLEGGVLVYLRGHEGRGMGLGHKISAYALQEQGFDTVDANVELGLPVDSREYGIGAQILADLGVRKVRLMTNNPGKVDGLARHGLEIVERVPLSIAPTDENRRYLSTKRERLGHLFEVSK